MLKLNNKQGYPVVPLLDTEFASPPLALSRWLVSLSAPSPDLSGADAAGGEEEEDVEWEEAVGVAGAFLVPRAEDKGKLISVEVTPVRGALGAHGEDAHAVGVPFTHQVLLPLSITEGPCAKGQVI